MKSSKPAPAKPSTNRTKFRTLDRTLALRCKQAKENGKALTVNYESPGGWNRATGIVRSVRLIKTSPLKPLWEIVIVAGDPVVARSRTASRRIEDRHPFVEAVWLLGDN